MQTAGNNLQSYFNDTVGTLCAKRFAVMTLSPFCAANGINNPNAAGGFEPDLVQTLPQNSFPWSANDTSHWLDGNSGVSTTATPFIWKDTGLPFDRAVGNPAGQQLPGTYYWSNRVSVPDGTLPYAGPNNYGTNGTRPRVVNVVCAFVFSIYYICRSLAANYVECRVQAFVRSRFERSRSKPHGWVLVSTCVSCADGTACH